MKSHGETSSTIYNEQLDEAARTYLTLVGGYGKVSPDMLKIMESYLEREKKS